MGKHQIGLPENYCSLRSIKYLLNKCPWHRDIALFISNELITNYYLYLLYQFYVTAPAVVYHFPWPDGRLDLSNVCLFEQLHGCSGLADSSSD
jgi:hypothetical protein